MFRKKDEVQELLELTRKFQGGYPGTKVLDDFCKTFASLYDKDHVTQNKTSSATRALVVIESGAEIKKGINSKLEKSNINTDDFELLRKIIDYAKNTNRLNIKPDESRKLLESLVKVLSKKDPEHFTVTPNYK